MAEKTEKKSAGSAKRYGARYGRTTREKIGRIEKDMRTRQKCPYCAKNRVKRVAAGIWLCKNCKVKFSGAAYTLKRTIKSNEVTNG